MRPGGALRGAQRTLWGAFTQRVAVFSIASDRHEERLRELLGEHRGDRDLRSLVGL